MRQLSAVLLATLTLLAPAAARADKTEAFTHDESPYELRLDIDIAAVVLGGVLWGGTTLIGNTVPPSYCGTSTTPACNPKNLNAFDRLALGHSSQSARTAANIIEFVPLLYLAIDIGDVGLKHWKTYLTDLWVFAEVLGWNGGIQDVVRRAVRRPRPFLYTPGLYSQSERDAPDAGMSFYSGHTAFAFAIATTAAYTFTLRHPHWWVRWLVWPSLMLVASVEPFLRVYSGDHFPTDVIAGAVAGSAIGLLIPALHRRTARSPSKILTGMRLVPVQTNNSTTLSLVGMW